MKNLQNLLVNGGLWSVYNIFTSFYLSAFAIALGASNTVIGLLGAVPYIAALVAEIPGAKLVEYVDRKNLFVFLSCAERLCWLPMIFVPVFFVTKPLLGIIAVYLLSRIFSSLFEPAWVSAMADIVPRRIRGSFFGQRNRVIEAIAIATTFFAGWYLDMFRNVTGFQSLMAVGILFGLASTATSSRLAIPKLVSHHHHPLKEFFTAKGAWKSYLVFVCAFYFAVMFASPFFTVYMLDNLGMSYSFYGFASAMTSLARVLSFRPLGRLSDKIGDKKLAFVSVLCTGLVPLSFMFITPTTVWLIVPAQILSGVVWAGVDLLLFNLLLDFSHNGNRAVRTAEFSMAISISSVMAPILGGIVADKGSFMLSGIPLVFAVAAVARFLSAFLLLKLPEPRAARDAAIGDIFHEIVAVDPIKGAQHSLRRAVKAGRLRLKLWFT